MYCYSFEIPAFGRAAVRIGKCYDGTCSCLKVRRNGSCNAFVTAQQSYGKAKQTYNIVSTAECECGDGLQMRNISYGNINSTRTKGQP
jgi:hypothetical protein